MKTFSQWIQNEWNKDPDNMCPPPLDAQLAINFLKNYLLGEDWYSTMPMSTEQVNTQIVDAILIKYSRRYLNERRPKKNVQNPERNS